MAGERQNQMQQSANLNNEMPAVPVAKFFQTVEGPGDTPYPAKSENPNVYYCRMLKDPTFVEEVGQQDLTYGTTDIYKHVFNLESAAYIEEGSIIRADPQYNRWWTVDKVKGGDAGMVAYTYGSYVVVLDDRTGSIVWGPQLITHERYTEHPTASYWEQFREGWETNSGPGVDGMTYLRALRAKFDRAGNLYVAYDLVECKDITGVGSSTVGAVVTSGMVRFDYDMTEREFTQNWQVDCSKWFIGTGGDYLLTALGWYRAVTETVYSTWAAFDVDDDGNLFYGAFGWETSTDDAEIMTLAHFRERYNRFTCDTDLGATWLVQLYAETGSEITRLTAGQAPATTLPVDQQSTVPAGAFCYPVWLGDIRAMGNGRLYLHTRCEANNGYPETGYVRRDETGAANAYQRPMMQIDTAGNWRDRGGDSLGGRYLPTARHDAISMEWHRESGESLYQVRALVMGDFTEPGLDNPGPSDGCNVDCASDSFTARSLGRFAYLLRQSESGAAAWTVVFDLPGGPCNFYSFNMCDWIRSGTHGFPIASRSGFNPANAAVASCDIHDGRALIHLGVDFGYVDNQNNQRRSRVLWLDENLKYQPLPQVYQLDESITLGVRSGYHFETAGRFGNFVRYDTNDDSGNGTYNGTAIWSFEQTAVFRYDTPGLIEQTDRVYKVNQNAAVVWSSLGDELNPSHELYASGGSEIASMPLAGEGIGTSSDIYDPRENPASPNYAATFKGRRFVPALEDQSPPSPPNYA